MFIRRSRDGLNATTSEPLRQELTKKLLDVVANNARGFGILHGRMSSQVLVAAQKAINDSLADDLKVIFENPLSRALAETEPFWQKLETLFGSAAKAYKSFTPVPSTGVHDKQLWFWGYVGGCAGLGDLQKCKARFPKPNVGLGTTEVQLRQAKELQVIFDRMDAMDNLFASRAATVEGNMRTLVESYMVIRGNLLRAVGLPAEPPPFTIDHVRPQHDVFARWVIPRIEEAPTPHRDRYEREANEEGGRGIKEALRELGQTLSNAMWCSHVLGTVQIHQNSGPPSDRLVPDGVTAVPQPCQEMGFVFDWDVSTLQRNENAAVKAVAQAAEVFTAKSELALDKYLQSLSLAQKGSALGIEAYTKRVVEKALTLQFLAQEAARRVEDGTGAKAVRAKLLEGSEPFVPFVEELLRVQHSKAQNEQRVYLPESLHVRFRHESQSQDTGISNMRGNENPDVYFYWPTQFALTSLALVQKADSGRLKGKSLGTWSVPASTEVAERLRDMSSADNDRWVHSNPGVDFVMAGLVGLEIDRRTPTRRVPTIVERNMAAWMLGGVAGACLLLLLWYVRRPTERSTAT